MSTATPPRVDEAARRRIGEDLDTSLVCQAGAGTGKTHALVERMVACVARGAVDIAHMAAITFTRKAAGELRGRFFLALQAAAAEEPEGVDGARRARRLREAVGRVDQCLIGTIHAFCARILRQRPLEAGLPPDFSEVEEREELWLLRDAWDRFLQARSAAGDERLLAIEDTGLTAEQFYHFFLRRCQYSDLPLKPTEGPRPDLEPGVIAACAFVREVAAQIPEPLPEGEPDELMQTVQRLRHVVDFSGPPSDADRERLLRELASTTRTRVTLKRWGAKGSPAHGLARRLRDDVLPPLRNEIFKPLLNRWRRYLYRLAGDLVDEAMAFYRDTRLAAATLTFNDLLELTAVLLRDHPEVRAAMQNRHRRLFVDEFQDTDPLQAEVLLYLTGTQLEERDWRRLTPAVGSLFLVGDEKQSIYRFRRADVDVFRLVGERVVAAGGQVVELTTSFRARPRLARWMNDAFEPLFEGYEPRYQATFRALHAERRDTGGAGVYRLRGRAEAGGRRQEQVADEASRIAAFIAAALRGDCGWNGADSILGARAVAGDFMILTRSRRHLVDYARALEEQAVPYDITGAGSLRTSSELRALVDALEAVLRTDDPVALVAYLRGLLVGLGDDELYRLRRAGWNFHLRAAPPPTVEDDLRERLQRALAQLRQLRRDLQLRPPAVALERFVESTGLAALAVARDGGSSRVGNLLRVLAIVRDAQSRRRLAWGRIAAELRDLLEEEMFRVEEMTLETGRSDVVRVMNLHQAKGLEAKVVFLADPGDTASRRHGVDVHVSRLAEQPYLSMAVARPGRFQPIVLAEPEGWEADAQEESRYAEAEELRLVYVAATRARDALVVGLGANHNRGPWAALTAALSGAQDLPEPPAAPAAPAPDAGEVVDVVAQRRDRDGRWERAREASYAQLRVTEEAETDLLDPDPETRGRGRAYGTVVHELFESAVAGRLRGLSDSEIAAYIDAQLTTAGLDVVRLGPAARSALACFQVSEIWDEISSAGADVHAEVPFAQAQGDTMLRGVIDLVYRLDDRGWKIVDYKTHQAAGDGAEAEDSLRARYAEQVEAYAAHWEAVSGERVVERGLWLAASDGTDRYIAL